MSEATNTNAVEAEIETRKEKIAYWANRSWETKQPTQFVGEPGTGKVTLVHDHMKTHLGLNVLPLYVPAALDFGLVPWIADKVAEADVILLDETRRADPLTVDLVGELVRNKTIGGVPLKENATIILCNTTDNEPMAAFEDRFFTVSL